MYVVDFSKKFPQSTVEEEIMDDKSLVATYEGFVASYTRSLKLGDSSRTVQVAIVCVFTNGG